MSKEQMTLEQMTDAARRWVFRQRIANPDFGQPPTNLRHTWANYGAEALLRYPNALAKAATDHPHAYQEARHGGAKLIAAGHTLPPSARVLLANVLDGSLKAPDWRPKRQADRVGRVPVYFLLKELDGRDVPLENVEDQWRSASGAIATALSEAGLKPNTPSGVYGAYRDLNSFDELLQGLPSPTEGQTIQNSGHTAVYTRGKWQISDWSYPRPWAAHPIGSQPAGLEP